jgi:hypothetical protein
MDTLTVVHLETFEVSPMLQEVVSTITPLVAKNGNRLEAPLMNECRRNLLSEDGSMVDEQCA